jgi:hypothetical protein
MNPYTDHWFLKVFFHIANDELSPTCFNDLSNPFTNECGDWRAVEMSLDYLGCLDSELL